MLVEGRPSIKSYAKGSPVRREMKRRGKIKNTICHPQVCFFLTEEKVILTTGMQVFVLEAVEIPGNLWERRLRKIRGLVLSRKIRDIDDLIRECGRGVLMTAARLEWYV